MPTDELDVKRLALAVFERRRSGMNKKLAKSLDRLAFAGEWQEFAALVLSEAISAGDLSPVDTEKAREMSRLGLLGG